MQTRNLLPLLVIQALLCGAISAQTSTADPSALRAAATPSSDQTWWKHAVVYEIYPRSFQDSNGDGIGDLNGITQRLDYLQKLGIDAIWISPMYPSPQVDFGYDISDYENVDPKYGSLADFDRLMAEAKKRNIRIMLDMVLNHTSDKHRWFIESASSRTNPKHDWYVWNDGVPGTGKNAHQGPHGSVVPPNNWISGFGGSAWEWNPTVKQFYYHQFYKQQPDLNWRNPEVEKAMFGSMQFWLDRGVAGFRLDAITDLFEDPKLHNNPETGGINAQGDPNLADTYTNNLPEVHDTIRRMRAMVAKYPGNRVLIGETYLPNTAELDKWYGGTAKDELQLPMDMIVGFSNRLSASNFRKRIEEVETQVHGSQPLLVFDNHDNGRSWERYGDGVHNEQIAKLIAAMLFTTHSTALMYYGEELGMVTSVPTRVEDVKDPIGITGWPKEKGRDGERTPMQWDGATDAGFSTASSTWLPVASNYKTVNVQAESGDPNSLLNWHKELIHLRRDLPALHEGGMVMLDRTNSNVLSYVRTAPAGAKAVVVMLNMSAQPQTLSLDLAEAGLKGKRVKTILTDESSLKGLSALTNVTLPPFSSWVGSVE
ncbi:glycoside hydrolase family 13 protein [Granulicella mallensis]|uniref:Alpha-amylase n=1 Tax=Granulicella mallensis (strain ATCC BAA-1857 / DSM 23137 / MP5ACTX8) TaxID=682795 RepID=G8NVR4_GRAMM|nr:alpha-glucosidase [Granulicella mallensis]AEU38817.1 alpha amylase catalytic region [Granulicella mallensis MP5ACTX8]